MKKLFILGLFGFLATVGTPARAAKYGVFAGMNNYLSSYIGSGNWLSGCVPDANHIYTNTIQRGGWTTGTVTRLLNSAGTKAAVRRGITNYAAAAVSGDTFLYYHSSHGGNNSDPYGKSVYLCSYDADYQDAELAADLAKFATGVKVVVMVDACHSGGLFQSSLAGTRVLAAATPGAWDLAGSVTKIMQADRAAKIARGVAGMDQLIAASEIGWITAANYDQYSWDGDTGGLFTDKVIEGWTNNPAASCDLNGDNYANFYELFDYSWDVANDADHEYTTAVAANTNVLLGTLAGWIGSAAPGGLVAFSNLTAQSVIVGQTLICPVGAYTSGTNVPAPVTMTTVQAGASYGSGQLTFTPSADGIYTFNFTATNSQGSSATAALTVTATLAAPTLSAATGIGNDRFTANWSAVSGAASYVLDVATNTSFSAGGSGATGTIVSNVNTGLSPGWEYVNGASNAGTYHKLLGTGDPGVVSPAISTVGYTNAAASFSVATFGGIAANALTVSYSLNGGSSWTAIGTNTGASNSSPYVSGSLALPAGALGQASVRVKWHCAVATASIGLRLQNLNVSGAQPAGGNTLVLNAQSVAGTTYGVTGLVMHTPYFYRVKAVGNSAGPLSSTGTVTTTASDSAPSFATIPGQSATVGTLFTLGVTGYASGSPAPTLALFSSTASAADYGFSGGTLSFTPSATGTFAFVFRASNTLGIASATATVAVAAAPVYIPTASIANVSSNSFTVNWTATTGGTTYQVQVATDDVFTARAASKGILLTEDFADFSDWTDGGTASDTNHAGAASPCRALGSNDTLTSPGVNYPTQMTFFADASSGGNNKTTTNYYSLDGGASWLPVGAFTVGTAGATVTQALTSSPNLSGATNVLFRFVSAFNTWYVDDVAVTGGGGGGSSSIIVDQTVAELTYGATGLTPSTPYHVRVRANGGDWSAVVSTTTAVAGASGTPPAMDVIGSKHVLVGKTLNCTVAATQTDGDPILSYACASAVSAARWTFNANSGAFSFAPTTNEVGAAQFNFTATDKDGPSAPVAMTVAVCSPTPVSCFDPPTNGTFASATIASQVGITYGLQYTTNFLTVPTIWISVDSQAGTGSDVILRDESPADPQRFYRVVIP
jgi:hypothetical protein